MKEAMSSAQASERVTDSPKSVMQARQFPLMRIFALMEEMRTHRSCSKETTHPFEVAVNDIKVVHIRQTIRDIRQLTKSVRVGGTQVGTYKPDAVYIWIHLGEIHDIPVFHPS